MHLADDSLDRVGTSYEPKLIAVLSVLLHEFGHEYESDHLSEAYYRALTELGAKVAQLALDKPKLFAIVPHENIDLT